MLQTGSLARIYRDGEALQESVTVPAGRMEIRVLAPGQYVARDECGNEVAFEVSALAEVAVVQDPGGDEGPVPPAGTSRGEEVAVRLTEPPKPAGEAFPEPQSPADVTLEDAGNPDQRTPGQAGASITHEDGTPEPAPAPAKKPAKPRAKARPKAPAKKPK
jgi:hypothetical protein